MDRRSRLFERLLGLRQFHLLKAIRSHDRDFLSLQFCRSWLKHLLCWLEAYLDQRLVRCSLPEEYRICEM